MARFRRFLLPAVLILLAVLLPFIDAALGTDALFTAITIAIFVMLALVLNIVVGFAGLLDLGFVAFYALGAYVIGWFASSQFQQVSFSFGSTATSITGENPAGIHLSFWIILFIAAAFAGLCGVIIGAMADQYIGTRWTAIVIFAVLILVLVFRPRGLLGDRSAVQGGGE